jgi:hypothetical protein
VNAQNELLQFISQDFINFKQKYEKIGNILSKAEVLSTNRKHKHDTHPIKNSADRSSAKRSHLSLFSPGNTSTTVSNGSHIDYKIDNRFHCDTIYQSHSDSRTSSSSNLHDSSTIQTPTKPSLRTSEKEPFSATFPEVTITFGTRTGTIEAQRTTIYSFNEGYQQEHDKIDAQMDISVPSSPDFTRKSPRKLVLKSPVKPHMQTCVLGLDPALFPLVFIESIKRINDTDQLEYPDLLLKTIEEFQGINDHFHRKRNEIEIIYSVFLSNPALDSVFQFLKIIEKDQTILSKPEFIDDIKYLQAVYENVASNTSNFTKFDERELCKIRDSLLNLTLLKEQLIPSPSKANRATFSAYDHSASPSKNAPTTNNVHYSYLIKKIRAAYTWFSKTYERLKNKTATRNNSSPVMDNIIIEHMTLPKLIDKLCDNSVDLMDNRLTKILYTYDHYISALNLLFALLCKYYIPKPLMMSLVECRANRVQLVLPVKLRILAILKFWLDERPKDFHNVPHILTIVASFINKIAEDEDDVAETPIYKEMADLSQNVHRRYSKPRSTGELGFISMKEDVVLTEYTEEEIANQLTKIDSELYDKVAIYELMDKRWEKPTKTETPNYLKCLQRQNEFHLWIIYVLLTQTDELRRMQFVTKFIRIALICEELRNFASMHSIFSALFKLNKLGAFIFNKENSINFAKLSGIFEREDAVEKLIQIYRNVSLPAIPALWVYNRVLQKFQDGSYRTYLAEYDKTYVKYQCLGEMSQIIRDIKRLQSVKYPIQKHESLYRYLKRDFKENLKEYFNLEDKISIERKIVEVVEMEKARKKLLLARASSAS